MKPSSKSSVGIGIAGLSLLFTLAGCASGGGTTGAGLGSGSDGSAGTGASGNASGGAPVGAVAASTSPVGRIAGTAGGVVSAAGTTVSGLGNTVGATNLPVLGTQAGSDLGTVVSDTGGIVTTTGNGVSNGLGTAGISANPVGITTANTGNIVQATGQTVQDTGTLVANVGSNRLRALAPVTAPVGGVVNRSGVAVSGLGSPLTDTLSTGPVEQITQTLSSAIVPLTSQATQLTQTAGTTSGLGRPVSGLLGIVGGAVMQVGDYVKAGSGVEVVDDVGNLVTATGNTVVIAGVLLSPNAGQAGDPVDAWVNGVPGFSYGVLGTSAVSPIVASLNPLYANGLNGLNGLNGANAYGNGGLLSPVVNGVGGLVGGIAGNANGIGAASPLSPVTALIGGNNAVPAGTGLLAPVGVLINNLSGNTTKK